MDVGQVRFSIVANGLDSTLNAVDKLETQLNNIDGNTYGSGAARAEAKRFNAKRRALRMAANIEAKYASQQHKTEIKSEKQRLKVKQRALRMAANIEAKYATQQHAREKKAQADALKAQEKAYREQNKARAEFQRGIERQLVESGSRLQTLGSAFQRMTEPFVSIQRGLLMGIGYRALGAIENSVSGAFSRYDIMQTYDKVLKQIGLDAETKFAVGTGKAKTAIDNLNDSVLGLPTGLDEIVASMRVYAGITGDVEKATKIAIAANNAFVSGGMDETRQRMAERQLQNILSNGDLTAAQWNSLQKNMPTAFNAVAKQLGYAQKDAGKLLADLKASKVSADEFVDAFIEVGTNGSIRSAAEEMKQTWNAVAQNMQNAVARAGEGILKTLDSVYKKTDGRTFLQHVLGIDKNGEDTGDGINGIINDMSESLQKWIKANPEKITGFFEDLRSIDWKGIAGGFASTTFELARFYASIGKIVGGGTIVKLALGLNMLGKGIQLFGGLKKGFAGPVSRLITALTFGGKGKDIKTATDTMGDMAEAGKAAEGMAVSWQGVATKAIAIAAIPALAWSLKETALALQEFDKVHLSWGLAGKILAGAGAVTAFGALAAAFGALMVGTGPIGWITAGGVAAGTLGIAGISKAMKWAGEGLNAIANADIPSAKRIKEVTAAMNDIASAFTAKNPFEAIGLALDSWSKGKEFGSISKLTKAFTDIKKIGDIKIDEGEKKRAAKNFKSVKGFIDELNSLFDDSKAREAAGTTNGAGWRGNTNMYSNWQVQVASFGNIVTSVSSAMEQMKTLLSKASELNSYYNDLKHSKTGFDFGSVKATIDGIADGMYSLLNNGKGIADSALYKLHKVSDEIRMIKFDEVASGIENLRGAVKQLKKFANIKNEEIDVSGITSLADTIDQALEALTRIGVREVEISINISAEITGDDEVKKQTQTKIDGIKKSIERMNGSIDKKLRVYLSGSVFGGYSLVSQVQNRINEIRRRINNINGSITKNVSVSTGGGGGGGGGGDWPHGGHICRANGGSLRRGTDTIPAVLTAGEYVLNRHATSMLGNDVLYKLNHLDIRGALNSLSIKAGHQSRTINNNSTKNANVTVNNYHSDGVGYGRAGRFVRSL